MDIRSIPRRSLALFKRAYGRSRTRTITAGILALTLIAVIAFALVPKGDSPEEAPTQSRAVQLASVSALSSGSSSFSVIANVQSKSEATVHTESSGEVTRLNRELGDTVVAGSVIAEMENASQRAAVAQAKAGVQVAEANLAKVRAGSRPEQVAILNSSLASAHSGAVNSLLSAYGTVEDSIRHTADLMFSNADTPSPTLNLTVADSQLPIDIVSARVALRSVLARESARSATLASSEGGVALKAEIALTASEVRAVRSLLDDLIAALDRTVTTPSISASDISGWKTGSSAARSSLTAALSSLSSADAAITSAEENLAIGLAGGTKEDVASAEAAVAQAEAGLAAAYASLEKTIIRAPIGGTINMLDLKRGDFKGASTPVVTIANNGALEAVAYITEEEARRIRVGEQVTLGTGRGTVTRIAPALDPSTQKIELRVGIEDRGGLTNGASVIVSFGDEGTPATAGSQIIIPLAAVKITVDGTSVFTVDAEQKLVAHPITLGTLLGERVVIESGISMEDIIVTDARGLKEGVRIEVQ